MRRPRSTRYGEFFHPVPLVALLLLVVNDHLLKGAGILPGAVTGKLSDFAGLLYFPLFATAALRWSGALAGEVVPAWAVALEQRLRLTPRKLLAACALTGAAFVALKLHRPFAELYISALAALAQPAAVTPDPTDLWALLSLPLAYAIGKRQLAHQTRAG